MLQNVFTCTNPKMVQQIYLKQQLCTDGVGGNISTRQNLWEPLPANDALQAVFNEWICKFHNTAEWKVCYVPCISLTIKRINGKPPGGAAVSVWRYVLSQWNSHQCKILGNSQMGSWKWQLWKLGARTCRSIPLSVNSNVRQVHHLISCDFNDENFLNTNWERIRNLHSKKRSPPQSRHC